MCQELGKIREDADQGCCEKRLFKEFKKCHIPYKKLPLWPRPPGVFSVLYQPGDPASLHMRASSVFLPCAMIGGAWFPCGPSGNM